MALRYRFKLTPSSIPKMAEEFMSEQSDESRIEEEKLIGLKAGIQKRGYLTKKELHRVARWKSKRTAYLTLENSPSSIKSITEKAFTSTNDWEKLKTLTQLQGIGYLTASVILHLYDEQEYPILDIHTIWASGWDYKLRISTGFWNSYVYFSRTTTNYFNISIRTLDRALSHYSKVNYPGNSDKS